MTKIAIEEADLFTTDLKQRVARACGEAVEKLDRSAQYSLRLTFFEHQLYSFTGIRAFEIPEEALPRYRRGKALGDKEKLEEVLSYQLSQAEEALEEMGLVLTFTTICGMPSFLGNGVEVELEEVKACFDEEPEGKRRKKSQPMKCRSIMPSFTSFVHNLESLAKRWEEKEKRCLTAAFGSEKTYEKYKKLAAQQPEQNLLMEIYREYEKEYGSDWERSVKQGETLRKHFLKNVRRRLGLTKAPADVPASFPELKFEDVSILEMPVYKQKKDGSAGSRSAGRLTLLTDGTAVRMEYSPSGKNHELPEEWLEDCFFSAWAADGEKRILNNSGLLAEIRKLIKLAEKQLSKAGYRADSSAAERMLEYMDMKRLIEDAARVK